MLLVLFFGLGLLDGVLVVSVMLGSVVVNVGLKVGDVIIVVDGEFVYVVGDVFSCVGLV